MTCKNCQRLEAEIKKLRREMLSGYGIVAVGAGSAGGGIAGAGLRVSSTVQIGGAGGCSGGKLGGAGGQGISLSDYEKGKK